MSDDTPIRVLPRITPESEHFWRGGEHGELRILRCQDCGYWIHPGAPRCPQCFSNELSPEAVSGLATVHTFTLNVHEWNPTFEHPYAVAIVELDEQDKLRLATQIVGCDPHDVHIDQRVEVVFEHQDDVWLPLFTPVDGES